MTGRQDPKLQKSRAPAPAKAGAGRVWGHVAALAAATGALLLASGAAAARADGGAGVAFLPYRDGPPPGFSGGFGEDTCQGCHFEPGVDVNEPGGSVSLGGVPGSWEAGKAYPITVTLTRAGMRVGGFELTARFQDGGAQAGALAAPADGGDRVFVTTAQGVQYAHQRLAGSALAAPDTARWTVMWTAPAGGGAVVFNVAANAANEDDSSSGDYVYAAEAKAGPAGR